MLVIQIKIVEIKEENLVLIYSKKVEGSKKDFIFQNNKNRGKNKMLRELDPCTEVPPQICQIWVPGTPLL